MINKEIKEKIIMVEIDKLKLNEENPRSISDDKLKKLIKSIKEFPEMLNIRPVVVDSDMVVLGGNMRVTAARKAGFKSIAIIKAENLTDERKREFIIKDNVGFGDWDFDELSKNWDVEMLQDWGLDMPSFEIYNKEEDTSNDTLVNNYTLIVECENEKSQIKTYDKLIEMGFNVKPMQY